MSTNPNVKLSPAYIGCTISQCITSLGRRWAIFIKRATLVFLRGAPPGAVFRVVNEAYALARRSLGDASLHTYVAEALRSTLGGVKTCLTFSFTLSLRVWRRSFEKFVAHLRFQLQSSVAGPLAIPPKLSRFSKSKCEFCQATLK